MPDIPAFCNNCGTAFRSGFSATNTLNLTLKGCTAVSCPRCGGTGSIPDGTFNIIGNAIQIINAPEHSIDKLRRLSNILFIARSQSNSVEEVEQKIQKEVPEFSSLRDIIPKTRTEFYAFLTLLIMALQILLTIRCSSNVTEINIQNIINQSIETVLEQSNNP